MSSVGSQSSPTRRSIHGVVTQRVPLRIKDHALPTAFTGCLRRLLSLVMGMKLPIFNMPLYIALMTSRYDSGACRTLYKPARSASRGFRTFVIVLYAREQHHKQKLQRLLHHLVTCRNQRVLVGFSRTRGWDVLFSVD